MTTSVDGGFRCLAHVREVICAGDVDAYDNLMNLLALTVQEPGRARQGFKRIV